MKQSQRELRKQHLQLLRDKAAQQKQLQELQQRVIDVQMLKFGKVGSCITSIDSFILPTNVDDKCSMGVATLPSSRAHQTY